MERSREFYLSAIDVAKLSDTEARDTNWRKRERARTLLMLHRTKSTKETAGLVRIHDRTVGLTKKDWLARGYESLVDRARNGAPPKTTDEQLSKLVARAQEVANSAKQLLAYHV